MDCPRCKLPLTQVDYEGVETDMCNNCWGFWLDSGELEDVLSRRDLEFTDEEREQILAFTSPYETGPVEPASCPHCSEVMERVHYEGSTPLVIDVCKKHGLWLDTGEIKKVQAIAERSSDIHMMLIRKLGLDGS